MQVAPLFSAAEIETRIAELAARLYRDYVDCPLCLLGVADGAARFVDALIAELAKYAIAPEVHIIRVRRGRHSTQAAVQVDAFDPSVLDGRDVLVVDGIVGGGAKLRAVLEIVALAETRSVRTAVLIGRRDGRSADFRPDYTGFEVEGGWIVGFGMDIDGELHDLDEIGVVVEDA